MEIENIAWIRFASRRTAQQQRNLAIGHGMLGKIVVDAQRMTLRIAEVLGESRARIGRDVLHGRRIAGRGDDHHRVVHGAVVRQRLHHLGNRRALLADRHIDADQVFAFIVDDGVERDGRLAGLAVADDQLALSAANGDHRIDGLQPRRHRFAHRLTVDHAGSNALHGIILVRLDRPFVVNRLPESVHHAADEGIADRNAHDSPGALHFVALCYFRVIAQQHRTDLVFLQVHGDPGDAVRERKQLAGHDFLQAVYTGDAIAQREHRADFVDRDLGFVVFDLLANELRNLVCFNLSHK